MAKQVISFSGKSMRNLSEKFIQARLSDRLTSPDFIVGRLEDGDEWRTVSPSSKTCSGTPAAEFPGDAVCIPPP